jgi:septal ring factor EnvC (AmiA/AmiB activator)
MKMRRSFLILLTAALPMLATMAEDTGKTETTNSQTTSDVQNKTSAGKDQMACKRSPTADLDKLIADMNAATADNKVDAIAAAVAKLAEEFKASQQKPETKTADAKHSEMGMCKMMMSIDMVNGGDNQEGDHEHHH